MRRSLQPYRSTSISLRAKESSRTGVQNGAHAEAHLYIHIARPHRRCTNVHISSPLAHGESADHLHHIHALKAGAVRKTGPGEFQPIDSEKTGANTGDYENWCATISSTRSLHVSVCAIHWLSQLSREAKEGG